MPFFCIHISQGGVPTCLKRGEIFKHEFVANLLPSRLVKKIRNRIIVSEVVAKCLVSYFFDSQCRTNNSRNTLIDLTFQHISFLIKTNLSVQR